MIPPSRNIFDSLNNGMNRYTQVHTNHKTVTKADGSISMHCHACPMIDSIIDRVVSRQYQW